MRVNFSDALLRRILWDPKASPGNKRVGRKSEEVESWRGTEAMREGVGGAFPSGAVLLTQATDS